jgi:hypothetical protein
MYTAYRIICISISAIYIEYIRMNTFIRYGTHIASVHLHDTVTLTSVRTGNHTPE